MPTISAFYGIVIHMYWDEDAPPHIHALYAEYEVIVDIRTLAVTGGSFPRRALAMVKEWAVLHQSELMENWKLCEKMQPPKKVSPLE